ncbi:hypothetical protein T08_6179 [Trichinella sp. T8]|nr:hypothetical protein T08_6179 [Trichinella sp. T8]
MFTSILQRELKRALVAYASEGNLLLLNKLLTGWGRWRTKMLMMMILIGRQLLRRSSSKVDKYQACLHISCSLEAGCSSDQLADMSQCSKENDRQAITNFFWIVIILMIFEEEAEGLSKLLWIHV